MTGTVRRGANARRAADRVDAAPLSSGRAEAADGTSIPIASRPLDDGQDRATFTEFYTQHFAGLVRLAALVSGSADAAPDLVQDCFVRLHGRWSAVRDPLPYLRRCVVHACVSHHRRLDRHRRLLPARSREVVLEADELEDALARLPARQRAAVVLRYYSDLPEADIARALDCRPATVRSLIRRALTDLRKAIEP